MQDDVPYISEELFAEIVRMLRENGATDAMIADLFPAGARSVTAADWSLITARARARVEKLLAAKLNRPKNS